MRACPKRWPLLRVAVAEHSMEPALRPGDWLLAWRTRRVRPGQVVLAWHPQRPGFLLVKRAAWREDGGLVAGVGQPGRGRGGQRPLRPGAARSRSSAVVLVRYWPLAPPAVAARSSSRDGAGLTAAGPGAVSCGARGSAAGRAGGQVIRRSCSPACWLTSVEHLIARQLGRHRPEVDGQAEHGDDQDVPPERDVDGVSRRQRRCRGPPLYWPCQEMMPMPIRYTGSHWRGLPVQRRPLRVERHEDADERGSRG